MSERSRAKKAVESGLSRKGFEKRTTDHNYYNYHTLDGVKTHIRTKTSFGHQPKDIRGDLIRFMARQCALSVEQFVGLVDCPLSRDDYEKILRDRGIISDT